MRIVISPFSRNTPSGKPSPKNYPYWQELINMLSDHRELIVQLGSGNETQLDRTIPKFNLSFDQIQKEIETCGFWMSIDNFLPHMIFAEKIRKSGIVIFAYSDPLIFGYKMNLNLIKGRDFLRPNQFHTWDEINPDPNAFYSAEQIFAKIIAQGFLKS